MTVEGEKLPTLSSGVVLWHPLIQIGNLAARRGLPISTFKDKWSAFARALTTSISLSLIASAPSSHTCPTTGVHALIKARNQSSPRAKSCLRSAPEPPNCASRAPDGLNPLHRWRMTLRIIAACCPGGEPEERRAAGGQFAR